MADTDYRKMPCYHPITVYKKITGGITNKKHETAGYDLKLPCRQCIGCRIDTSRDWSIRCIHEAELHLHSTFVTLTYDDEHLPKDSGLHHKDFQLFMKRLRKKYTQNIRFYMCGEYGEEFGRPHFHALLFNLNFEDKYQWKLRKGNWTYRSPSLEKIWEKGLSEIGDVNYTSAAYVARYVMKKITGAPAGNHYMKYDEETGEIFKVEPEYNRMSLKPGIGAEWFEKYKFTDVYPDDKITLPGGKTRPVPKYYDRLLKESDPSYFETVQHIRRIKGKENAGEQTPERLGVRETVAKARNQHQRNLK